PIDAPSPPSYPLYAASDARSAPEVSYGAGPYRLSAKSDAESSEALASAGFQSGLSGNTALLTSTASLGPKDGDVVATATADIQALAIGPLAIGQIRSTATERLGADGQVVPAAAMEIT